MKALAADDDDDKTELQTTHLGFLEEDCVGAGPAGGVPCWHWLIQGQ